MRFRDVFQNVEIQSEYKVCRYDYEQDCRVFLGSSSALDYEVRYIYVDDGVLYFELSPEV